MPSIFDSAKLVLTDLNALPRISIISLLPFAVYNIFKGNFVIPMGLETPLIILVALVYLGYMFQVLTNSMKEESYTLSGLNVFSALWVGLKGVISCGIFTIPIYYAHNWISSVFTYSSPGEYVLAAIVYLVACSFLVTSMIFYGKRNNVFDGLNLIKILKNFHEIIVYLAISLILLIIFIGLTSLPIGAAVYGLFGFGPIFDYTICVLATINIMVYFQNISHAYFEQVKD